MELICKHDPKDPDHLICEMKQSPTSDWLRKRWQSFYCVGPTCPPHRAYTHLLVDIALVSVVLVLIVSNIVFLARTRGRDEELPDFETKLEQVASIAAPAREELEELARTPEVLPFLSLQAEALYFSAEGEQLGRGSWPPKVGEETKVMICLKPQVQGEFTKVVAQAKLGPAASWTGFAPISSGLSYDTGARRLRVEIFSEEIKENSCGQSVFELALNPTGREVASGYLLVLEEVQISGIAKDGLVPKIVKVPNVLVPITD